VIWAPVYKIYASADPSPRNGSRNFFFGSKMSPRIPDLKSEEVSEAVKFDFFCNALKHLENEMAAWVELKEPKTYVEAL